MTTDTATDQGRRTADHLPPELFRHWIHSPEEDQSDVRFFRAEGFAFPPSRGRDGMEMEADGSFVQHDLGPADVPVQTPGRWTQQGPGRLAVRFGGKREGYAFTVVGVDAELLRLRMAAAPPAYPSIPCADAEQMERFTSAPPATAGAQAGTWIRQSPQDVVPPQYDLLRRERPGVAPDVLLPSATPRWSCTRSSCRP